MALLIVYLLTGLVVGWQIVQLILWGIWGAPVSGWGYVGLLGAWGLGLAGVLARKRPPASALVALFGSVAAWCFYVPALRATLHDRQGVFSASVFLPPCLLVAATVCAVSRTLRLVAGSPGKGTERPAA